jgi:uncharacterized protein (DUF885 family)
MRFAIPILAVATIMGSSLGWENNEDAKLAAFFDRCLDEDFQRHPYSATRAGDHRFDDRMDDLSASARDADLAITRRVLADLPKSVSFEKLTRAGQIDFEILRHSLEYGLWTAENTKPFEDDPRAYIEYISDGVYLLFTQSTLPRDQTIRNAASRIQAIPKVVAAARQSLRNPPRQLTETAIKQVKGAINFYESGIFALSGEAATGTSLAGPCRAAVAALKELEQFLEKELLSRSTGDWRLGKDKFYRKLELELDAGLSADEVIRVAESEAIRVEREMVVIARQLFSKLFPRQALPADDAIGRRALVQMVLGKLADDHGSTESLVSDAKKTVDKIRRFITEKDILRLPEPDRCQVVEMPEFQRGQSTAYLNSAPPLDPKANSVYAVSPPPKEWDARTVDSYFREYNRSMLQILTIHEAYPGHYVQLEYSNRCPSKIRKLLWSGAFVEGWAVYTEQMMLDQGYGDGDLSLRLHQLKFYLRAVLNALLDHKMHCGTMTDEEVIDLLINRGFQSEGEAKGKVVRAKQSSCQLSTYFVGRTAHYRLRQQIQRELGDAFDLGRYHEAVLDFGSLPLKYLPDLVRERLKQPR